jgi:alkanesulfonate monooxygenase SsuD/methylene tetrahydromethanopterin reductase-like flavin-dependent oxidoreductase (luciferase family)
MGERGPRTDEAIAVMRKLWSAGPVTHEGRFFPMRDVDMGPGPARPGGPPIVIAGRKERPMRRAALLGDGWMPYLYSPRRYAASVETIRALAADAGRDLAGFGWFAFVFVNVNPDGDRARDETARALGGSYQRDFRAMVDSVAAAGTPREVTAKLLAFYDAGARHFVFQPSGPEGEVDAILSRLMGDVVPALREHAARS